MDELISERIKKLEKKLCALLDDLDVLYRAELYSVAHGYSGRGADAQINLAMRSMKKVIYNLELAVASAEGSEVIEQMKSDLDRFEAANNDAE